MQAEAGGQKQTSVGRKSAKTSKKAKIPAALREQVWLAGCGRVYEAKCTIAWCANVITVYDFHCGHNIPESKGGATQLCNLIPICARCNLSMGSTFTITEWKGLVNKKQEEGPVAVVPDAKTNPRWWRCACFPFAARK